MRDFRASLDEHNVSFSEVDLFDKKLALNSFCVNLDNLLSPPLLHILTVLLRYVVHLV